MSVFSYCPIAWVTSFFLGVLFPIDIVGFDIWCYIRIFDYAWYLASSIWWLLCMSFSVVDLPLQRCFPIRQILVVRFVLIFRNSTIIICDQHLGDLIRTPHILIWLLLLGCICVCCSCPRLVPLICDLVSFDMVGDKLSSIIWLLPYDLVLTAVILY